VRTTTYGGFAPRRRPRRGRSGLNAAGGPESVDVERSGDQEAADWSRLNGPRGVRNQRLGRHDRATGTTRNRFVLEELIR